MAEKIRLVVVGDLAFVGPRLRAAAAAAEKETRQNTRLLLRLCVSYGARHEVYRTLTAQQQQQQQQQQIDNSSSVAVSDASRRIEAASGAKTPQAAASPPPAAATAAATAAAATAAAAEGEPPVPYSGSRVPLCEQLRSGLLRGSWQPDELTRHYAKAFWVSLQGGDYALPEVLIRTSGEARLSDFLLCEVSEGCFFYLVPFLWPDIRPWHLLLCLLHKQVASLLAALVPSAAARLV